MSLTNKLWAVAGLLALSLLIVLIVSTVQFHENNEKLCDSLHGHYNSFDGTGQCIKDQKILFDPRHPYVP